MHATSRSIVAAARTHPAGIAAPSAVIVTAIVLFTLVTSVIVPSIRPGLFGVGSAPTVPPSPDQPRHRTQPQPVPTGPPVLPSLAGSIVWNASSPSGGSAPNPAGGGQPPTSPNPPVVSGFPPGTVPEPVVGPHLPVPSSGGCPVCCTGTAPGSAVVAVVTGTGNALQAVTQAVSSMSVVPAVNAAAAPVAAVVTPVAAAVAPVAAAVTAAGTATAAATAAVPGTATGAGTAAATAVGQTVQAAARVPAGAAAEGQPPSGAAGVAVEGQGQVSHRRSVESSLGQALPTAGSLPGSAG
jgi:hypothetical protein